ncbi:bile acid:sodium symporter family protein [Desulfobacca acetoxidans]|uniref:Bile acid:sodium symporter n=1 Tax=Desulfobacca acetoxidans (strain ATCC 700848 / DSM 11109 / ASRB2) TaxID=880072 RepID=F2NF86_DESAR|nr:bile acid:sodium symporter [Desulfobacca acetoxidans]AEB08641.1 Bile acid:sodium symporter [Desulfobacca acetoxidans DSM 11109]
MHLAQLAHLLIFIWLICLMFQVGLSVTVTQILASCQEARVLMRGLVVNLCLVPLFGFGLLLLFKAESLLSVGFLIAICFSGAPMGPAFTGFARGDVPFAIGLMVLLAFLTPLISPAVLSLLMGFLTKSQKIEIDYVQIVTPIFVGQFLPLGMGLTVNSLTPGCAGKVLAPVKMINKFLMLAVCVLVVATEYKTLKIFGIKAAIGIPALFAASAIAGWWLGGPGKGKRKAVMFNTTIRNASVALVIASGNFPGTPALAATFAYSLFSAVGTVLLIFLVRKTCDVTG